MERITLYIQPGFQVEGRARCFSGTPFAIKVQRALQYKRLAFDVCEVGWAERADLLPRISASGKLPVLEYDGERIEDSTEIAHFLESRHAEPPLVPADPALRARCHFLEEWADEVLYWYGIWEPARLGGFDTITDAYYADLPEAERRKLGERARANVEENLNRQGVGRYPNDKVMGDVCRGLDGLAALAAADGFVAGDALSLADVALFGQLHRRLAGTNLWLEGEVRARQPLVEWYERVDRATTAG